MAANNRGPGPGSFRLLHPIYVDFQHQGIIDTDSRTTLAVIILIFCDTGILAEELSTEFARRLQYSDSGFELRINCLESA